MVVSVKIIVEERGSLDPVGAAGGHLGTTQQLSGGEAKAKQKTKAKTKPTSAETSLQGTLPHGPRTQAMVPTTTEQGTQWVELREDEAEARGTPPHSPRTGVVSPTEQDDGEWEVLACKDDEGSTEEMHFDSIGRGLLVTKNGECVHSVPGCPGLNNSRKVYWFPLCPTTNKEDEAALKDLQEFYIPSDLKVKCVCMSRPCTLRCHGRATDSTMLVRSLRWCRFCQRRTVPKDDLESTVFVLGTVAK